MAEPDDAPAPPPDPYAGRRLTAAQLRGQQDIRPWLVQILRWAAIAVFLAFVLAVGWVAHIAVAAFVLVAVVEVVALVILVRSVMSLVRSRRG